MTDQQKIMAIVCGAALFWYAMNQDGGRRRELPVPPQDAPNFAVVFADNPDRAAAKEHANRLGDMCWELAEKIVYDKNKGDNARFKSDGHIEDFRVQIRDYLEEGGSYGELYPQLGPVMSNFFTGRLGDKPADEFTDERREQWISAFRGVSAALLNAAEDL